MREMPFGNGHTGYLEFCTGRIRHGYLVEQAEFHFTIVDVARFLNKSSVTLRGWERQGLITFPREGTDRKLTCAEVIDVAHKARALKRIPEARLNLIITAVTILQIIERENK